MITFIKRKTLIFKLTKTNTFLIIIKSEIFRNQVVFWYIHKLEKSTVFTNAEQIIKGNFLVDTEKCQFKFSIFFLVLINCLSSKQKTKRSDTKMILNAKFTIIMAKQDNKNSFSDTKNYNSLIASLS